MTRTFLLILVSICLALAAGFVNFEILSSPAVTIASERGEMQMLVYFFFLGISLTFATVFICLLELFSLLKNQIQHMKLAQGKRN